MDAPAGGAWRSKSATAAKLGAAAVPSTSKATLNSSSSSSSSKSTLQPAIQTAAGAQSHTVVDERMMFVASVLIGCTVQVQVKTGTVYEGIFHALRCSGDDFDVLLRMAKPVTLPGGAPVLQRERPKPVLAIEGFDLVHMTAVDVRMGASDMGSHGSAWDDAGGFGTDAAISRTRGAWGRERELQRWAPDEGEAAHMLHLEESVGPVGRGWDQFAVNESKFGVRTDYAEELYTTELDPSKSKISVAEAARIAAEIERGDHSALSNIHMLEERGVAIDDSQMDEEDRYGAVVRDTAAAPPAGAAVNGSANTVTSAPRPNAWAQGRPRQLMPGGAPSAPISIDTRREANKLRMQMTAAIKQTSPYGTPNAHKRASPLSSPLISDPSKLEALNLNPGVPHVDEATRREFEQFKAQQAASKSGDMFKKQDIHELRQFSQKIEGKLSRSLGGDSKMPVQLPSALAAAAAAAAMPAPAQEDMQGAASTGVPAAQQQASAAAATAAGGTEQLAGSAGPGAEPPRKSALNPFAKSFNFNPNAKEFKPTFTPAATAAPSAAGPVATSPPPAGAAAAEGIPGTTSAPGGLPLGTLGGPLVGGIPAGAMVPSGFKQGPPSPLRGPMQPGIPMPDMRPDYRRMPRGDGRDMDGGGPYPPRPERDGSFGRRREESRERGGPGFDRRREGRHFEGGPGMRPGEGPPPPPPGKGPGGPQGMQMSMMPGQHMMMPPGMMAMPGSMSGMGGGMVPVMMGPGMGGGPGQHMFMVRPMGPGQPGMVPMMQGGMMPGMGPGMVMVPPSAMSSPGQRPMMMPQMMMMHGHGMAPGMMMPAPGGGPPGSAGVHGGKADDRGE